MTFLLSFCVSDTGRIVFYAETFLCLIRSIYFRAGIAFYVSDLTQVLPSYTCDTGTSFSLQELFCVLYVTCPLSAGVVTVSLSWHCCPLFMCLQHGTLFSLHYAVYKTPCFLRAVRFLRSFSNLLPPKLYFLNILNRIKYL